MLCNAICLNYEDFNGCFTHYVMNCLLLHIMKCEVNYVVKNARQILLLFITMYQIICQLVYHSAICLLKFLYENPAYIAV
jgi:hypothetical protein